MKAAIARFRFWLLGWYFAVSALALLGFGGAAYWVFERRLLRETDEMLLGHIRGEQAPGNAVQGFRFDAGGRSRVGDPAPEWLLPFAREAARVGSVAATFRVDEDREEGGGSAEENEHYWRIVGSRVVSPAGALGGPAGPPGVLLAVTDLHVFRERTADLLLALALAGCAALLLVGGGGYVLFRRTMAPAEMAFEGMRRFTGDVAHEVRTPLQLIRGQVDVALQLPRDAEGYRNVLESVGIEAQRLSHVVDGLLTLARAEAGAAGIARQSVRLDDLVFETLPAAQRLAAAGTVTVDVDVEGEGRVVGDPVLLRQALLSVVDNALRHSPERGRVTIRGRWEGAMGILEVDDQGPGIPTGEREELLERFGGRGGEGRKGLGLPIVRWIAEAHGGRVAILDAPGGGTRIRILLPGKAPPG